MSLKKLSPAEVAPRSSVRWPTSTNPAGYEPERAWRKRLLKLGILCPKCKVIRRERLGEIEEVIVQDIKPVGGHYSGISDVGNAGVLSREAVELMGPERLVHLGSIVPIVSVTGQILEAHVGFIGWHRGALRSHIEARPTLCRECGRLLYWPGWPPRNWRLLRCELEATEGDPILIGDWLLCSESLWEAKIEPAKLPRVKGHAIQVIEEPTDGLPADYDDMVAEVRRRGWIT